MTFSLSLFSPQYSGVTHKSRWQPIKLVNRIFCPRKRRPGLAKILDYILVSVLIACLLVFNILATFNYHILHNLDLHLERSEHSDQCQNCSQSRFYLFYSFNSIQFFYFNSLQGVFTTHCSNAINAQKFLTDRKDPSTAMLI